jgi:hypothetical protein
VEAAAFQHEGLDVPHVEQVVQPPGSRGARLKLLL